MSQQINLLDSSLKPSQDWLTLRNIALACAGMVVLVAATAGIGMFRERKEMHRFQLVEANLRKAQDSLGALAGLQANRRIDPVLEAELSATQARLQAKERVADMLERGGTGNRKGFASFMQGFARQVSEGVWLTGFDISASGRTIEVRGNVLSESALPKLVSRLQDEEAFRGRQFGALNMKRVDPVRKEGGAGEAAEAAASGQPYVEFVLSGVLAAKTEAERKQ